MSRRRVELKVRAEGATADCRNELTAEQLLLRAQLVELAQDAIIVQDWDGVISFWNASAEQIYGFTRKEAVGSNIHALLRTVFPEELNAIRMVVATNGSWEGELLHTRKDGSTLVVSSRWAPRPVAGHRPDIIEINRDITQTLRDRRQLEETSRLFQRIADTTPEIVYLYDVKGARNLYINRAVETVLGFTPEEVVSLGSNLDGVLFHPEDAEERENRRLSLLIPGAESPDSVEIRMLRKDGSVRWIRDRSAVFTRDANGVASQVVGLAEDVTDSRLAESLYRAIFSSVNVGIVVIEGPRFMELNNAFCQMIGRGRDDAVGFPARSFLAPGQESSLDEIQRSLNDYGHWSGEMALLNSTGGAVELFWSVSRATEGRVLGVAVDISALKSAHRLLEESRERLSMAVEVAGLGVWHYDLVTHQAEWNDALLAMYGFERAELSLDRFMEAVHPGDRRTLAEATERCLDSGATFDITYRARHTSGSMLYLRTRGHPSFDDRGKPVALDGVTLDVTDRVLAEQELNRRVLESTAELRAAHEEAESWNYSVSHDLRAPLRAITATARMLELDFGESLSEEALGLVRRQAGAAKRLASLIDELLEMSRLARQEMVRKPLDLTAMFKEVAAELQDGESRIEVADGLRAVGDPRLIQTVIVNLLDNALKYSPGGGPIKVGSRNGSFFVSDQGVGFDQRYVARIFEPFQRLHGSEDFPGTGIGLHNVKRIIERHGGAIWAESRPGEGATFYFRLESTT